MEDEQPREISKFNEGLLQIQRLDYLWRQIELVTRSDYYNPNRWKFLLDSVWRELYADVEKQPNKETIVLKNKILRKKIIQAKEPNHIYDTLNERHEYLKQLQTQVGKGGSYQDGTESEFE